MKLYSDVSGHALRQVVADIGIILWVAAWVWAGRRVHDATMLLAEPGRQLETAGTGIRDSMTNAGTKLDDLPLVDDAVATPFRNAAGTGTTIADAGRDLVASVERLALLLGLTTALLPILLVGAVWLSRRGRFVRRASAAQRFVDADADLDLFALRAIAHQPMPRLAAVSDDPVGAWRRSERETVRRLALLELKDLGLRPPAP